MFHYFMDNTIVTTALSLQREQYLRLKIQASSQSREPATTQQQQKQKGKSYSGRRTRAEG